MAEAAFALKAGQRSGVIETDEACYLMLVEDKRPERFKPLTEMREQIERDLRAQEQTRLQTLWVERLKKKTFVRRF